MDASVISLSLKLEAVTKKDGDNWVAWCLPLDVFSQAETQDGAMAGLKEAVELWFESCIDRHTLDKALTEAGFKIAHPDDAVPESADVVALTRMQETLSKERFANRDYVEVNIPAYIAAGLSQVRATR